MSNSFSREDFTKISFADKERFVEYYKRYPPRHSDTSFITMATWDGYMDYFVCWKEGHPFVMTKRHENVFFRLPSGILSDELLDKYLCFAVDHGGREPIGLIDQWQKESLVNRFKQAQFIEYTDYADYVYQSKDLASLEGGEYAKIRNRLNKFLRSHTYKVHSLKEVDLDELLVFLDKWCKKRRCEEDTILEAEELAVKKAVRFSKELLLDGIILKIDNCIAALSLFEKFSKDTMLVHFEKGDPELTEVYKAINWVTANYAYDEGFMYLNRESDMGVPGLRRVKKRYRPDHMIRVYDLIGESLPASLC